MKDKRNENLNIKQSVWWNICKNDEIRMRFDKIIINEVMKKIYIVLSGRIF